MSQCVHSELCAALADCYEELKLFLKRKYGCPQLAEEVVQETWMRLQRISTTAPLQQPRDYLFRIASNLAIDHLRADKTRSQYAGMGNELPDEVSCQLPLPDQVLDGQQRLQILLMAVEELPPRCREVFSLHKLEGLSHGEVAEKLGISKNMVEKHVIRGLSHCRECLGYTGIT